MRIGKPRDLCSSEITSREVYLNRRALLAGAAGLIGAATLLPDDAAAAAIPASKSPLSTDEKPTSLKDVTSYNNYYEFGVDKDDPAANAHTLTTKPWTVRIDGLVSRPADYALDDLIKPAPLEERIYRMRCVEGWSMVIPWLGVPLGRHPQARRAARQRQIRRLQDLAAPRRDAGAAQL